MKKADDEKGVVALYGDEESSFNTTIEAVKWLRNKSSGKGYTEIMFDGGMRIFSNIGHKVKMMATSNIMDAMYCCME